MYDGPTVVLLTLGVAKTLQKVLGALKESLGDIDPAVRHFATECASGGKEALLHIALIRLKGWRDLWIPREHEDDTESPRSDELLAILWGSVALREVKELLSQTQTDILFVEGVILRGIEQRHLGVDDLLVNRTKAIQKAEYRTWSSEAVTELQHRTAGLCDRIQSLEPLTHFAFRSRSGPIASIDNAEDDIGRCYRRISCKRHEVRPFIDFCNKSELSLNVRLATRELATKDSASPWSQPQHVLLVLEGDVCVGGRRPSYFVVRQTKPTPLNIHSYDRKAGKTDVQSRLLNLMQGQSREGVKSPGVAEVEVQYNERGFVVQACRHAVAATQQKDKRRQSSISRAQLPLLEETIHLSTSEKIEVACSLAHHALILFGSTWALCLNAWNLRRQESADSSWWKLHVHDDMVDYPSLRQPAAVTLQSQITEFGRLLLSLAVGSSVTDSCAGSLELAKDILPLVERKMASTYSRACLFCLSAIAPPQHSQDANDTDPSTDVLRAFFKEVCFP